eukprot:Nk52_evm18s294 gene=Nk52_evmTU18s294
MSVEHEVKQPKTPLPIKALCCVGIVQCCEAFQITIIFPFLPFMVGAFPGINREAIGTYTGILAASFSIGQFVSSYFWGRLADKLGSKPIILFSLVGTFSTMFSFGLVQTYNMAVLIRFLNGLLNGNVCVMKSFLGRVTDNTNQKEAFSTLGIAWGVGSTIAPAIGGLLANPAENISFLFPKGGFWEAHPYFLPCFACSALIFVAFFTVIFFMEEPRDGKGAYVQCSTQDLEEALNGDGSSGNTGKPNKKKKNGKASASGSHNVSPVRRGDNEVYDNGDVEREVLLGEEEEDTPDILGDEMCNESVAKKDKYEAHCSRDTDRDAYELKSVNVSQGKPPLSGNQLNEKAPLRKRLLHSLYNKFNVPKAEEAGDVEYQHLTQKDPIEDSGCDVSALPSIRVEDVSTICSDSSGGTSNGTILPTLSGSKNSLLAPSSAEHSSTACGDDDFVVFRESPSEKRKPCMMLSISLYGLLAFYYIMMDESFPLYGKTIVEKGGIGFNSPQIGSILSVMGLSVLVSNVFLLPILMNKFGVLRCFRWSLIGSCPVPLFFPVANALSKQYGKGTWPVWGMLMVLLLFKGFCAVFSFTSVMLFVNNSVPQSQLGRANGIGQSFSSLARGIGPALAGVIWSVSIYDMEKFPFNIWYTWILQSLVCFSILVLSRRAPAYLEHPYEEEVDEFASARAVSRSLMGTSRVSIADSFMAGSAHTSMIGLNTISASSSLS